MLLADGRIAPATRPVELDDHRLAIFDSDLVDPIFIAVEREHPTIAAKSRAPPAHRARPRGKARNKGRRGPSARFYRVDGVTPSSKTAVRMHSMRLPRPKSLSGLMLIGFTIVAAPLLFAIVNAAVQMNRLSNRSEQLVVHGMQGTRNNQRLFEEIGALERTARLYQIIPNAELLEVYERNNKRLAGTIEELLSLPLDSQSLDDARTLQTDADRAWNELKRAPPNSPRIAELINSYPADGRSLLEDLESRQRADRPGTDDPASRGTARTAESVLADAAARADDPRGRRLYSRICSADPSAPSTGRSASSAAAPSRGRSPSTDLRTWSASRRSWNGCASDCWIWRRRRIDSCDICRMN